MPCRPSAATLAPLALLLVTACMTARVTPYDLSAAADRRTPAELIRFYDVQQPRCAFRELGSITLSPNALNPWGKVIRKARQTAHELGGDAIIDIDESSRVNGAVLTSIEGKTGATHRVATTRTTSFTGTIIRFVDPACRE